MATVQLSVGAAVAAPARLPPGMALSVQESVLASLSSPRPGQQQNITLAASTGQYSDAIIRVGDQYQESSRHGAILYRTLRALTTLVSAVIAPPHRTRAKATAIPDVQPPPAADSQGK